MTRTVDWLAGPGAPPLRGRVRMPGDKSVSHRAIMLAAVAQGVTQIEGFLEAEDTRATAALFRALGVRIEHPAPGRRIVHGVGLHGLRVPAADLDCGNAGTAMRLLAGLLSGQRFASRLVGDASLSRRPMARVIEPLRAMGAGIAGDRAGCAPLAIDGGRLLTGGEHDLPVASAQVKSALLLAGLYATGPTRVREPHPTRDYTERMLQAFGAELAVGADGWIELRPGRVLRSPGRVVVPGDMSSAAFFIVAASLVPGSDLVIEAVEADPRRSGLLLSLADMGASIEIMPRADGADRSLVDLRVRHASLHGVEVPAARVPDMIDEFPALFVAAALAAGRTTVSAAGELRVKESDRIAVMARALRSLGVGIEERPDGALIDGGPLAGGEVDSAGDHRCAMALAVAGQCATAPVRIADCANVATSFPDFVSLAGSCGMRLDVRRPDPT